MFGDDAGLTSAVDQYVGVPDRAAVVKRKDILNEQPVIEQEKERGKERNEDNRIRNDVLEVVIVVEKVNNVDEHQVEKEHIDDPDTILDAGVAYDTAVVAGDENGYE